MKTFLHLLWWRLKLCKWYFLLLLVALLLQAAAWGTLLAIIPALIAAGIATLAPVIIYKSDFKQGGSHYLATRPVGWQPVFWSRSIVGILLIILSFIALALSFWSIEFHSPDIFFLIFVPLMFNLYFWEAGGITISRNLDGGYLLGTLAFTVFLILAWKNVFPLFQTITTLYPEGKPGHPDTSLSSSLILGILETFSVLLLLGLLGIVECSMYRRKLSLPVVSCLLILAYLGMFYGGYYLQHLNGQTSCYKFYYPLYEDFLGYRQDNRDLLLVVENKRGNNTLFRLNIDDPTAKPTPVCIVGATWDSTLQHPSYFESGFDLMSLLEDPENLYKIDVQLEMLRSESKLKQSENSEIDLGYLNHATILNKDIIPEQLKKRIEQALFPPNSNPYQDAIILEDRILLVGHNQYEILEFDGIQATSLCPPQQFNGKIQSCKKEDSDHISLFIKNEDQSYYEYDWQFLNLRTGETSKTLGKRLPTPPDIELEVGDKRFCLDIREKNKSGVIVEIERRDSPQGTERLSEIPFMRSMVLDKNAIAGFIENGTYWPSWKIRLYDIREPSQPTFIDIDFPIQFYDPITLAGDFLDTLKIKNNLKHNFFSHHTPFLVMGGGYLTCCKMDRMATWDISNPQDPKLLGTAPLRNYRLFSEYIPDFPIHSTPFSPFFTLSGPITPILRKDGALGYIDDSGEIHWFKFPSADEEENS